MIVAAPIDEADLGQAVESLQAGGVETVGLAAEIADDRAAGSLIELACSRFGRGDVLINNAGIAYFEEFLETPVDHLDRTLDVNVRGTLVMSREVARVMEPVSPDLPTDLRENRP